VAILKHSNRVYYAHIIVSFCCPVWLSQIFYQQKRKQALSFLPFVYWETWHIVNFLLVTLNRSVGQGDC